MEPHGSVAKWDGNRLTIWDTTQGVYSVQEGMARAMGLPLANVRVIGHYMGGGFGAKLEIGKYTVYRRPDGQHDRPAGQDLPAAGRLLRWSPATGRATR